MIQQLLDDASRLAAQGTAFHVLIGLYGLFLVLEPWGRRRTSAGAFARRAVHNLLLTGAVFALGWWLHGMEHRFHDLLSPLAPLLLLRLELPLVLELLIFLLLYDLALYAWHVASHRWRWLWRMHQVHHSDVEVDVTTSYRHHPLELVFALIPRLGVILLLGPEPAFIVLYEWLRLFTDTFSHADLALPPRVERALRWVIITPDMHRIHHSAWRPETDSNYGNLLSGWDRLFGTFRWRPLSEQATMRLGLEYFRDDRDQTLPGMLLQPFRKSRRASEKLAEA